MIFQCSISKANYLKERALLEEAGLLLPIQDARWIRYTLWGGSPRGYVTLENGFTNSTNVIITAREFITIVHLHKLNPSLTVVDLLRTLKLNQRNRSALSHTRYEKELNLEHTS